MPRTTGAQDRRSNAVDLDQLLEFLRIAQMHEDSLDENDYAPYPQWPLKFEKLDGIAVPEFEDAMLTASDYAVSISSEVAELNEEGEESLFSGPQNSEMYRATLLALQAHASSTDAGAVEQARNALQISKICPEAYIVLAFLGFFRKVVDVLFKHRIKPPKSFIKIFKDAAKKTSRSSKAELNKSFAKYVLWKLEGKVDGVKWCSNLVCDKRSDMVSLKSCSGCNCVKYCSKDCQDKHWQLQHKQACKVFKEQK